MVETESGFPEFYPASRLGKPGTGMTAQSVCCLICWMGQAGIPGVAVPDRPSTELPRVLWRQQDP